jgi:hypothetical protein
VNERQLQQAISDLARMYGWLYYHTFDARHSPGGFPDAILVKPRRLIALELKTERGRLTPIQAGWLGVLATIEGCEARLVRPSDLQDTADLLAR